jgi:hypothetical protein
LPAHIASETLPVSVVGAADNVAADTIAAITTAANPTFNVDIFMKPPQMNTGINNPRAVIPTDTASARGLIPIMTEIVARQKSRRWAPSRLSCPQILSRPDAQFPAVTVTSGPRTPICG